MSATPKKECYNAEIHGCLIKILRHMQLSSADGDFDAQYFWPFIPWQWSDGTKLGILSNQNNL